ncbi:MAG: winged helix-turn-helix domain-containing protein [Candidatus Thermoplasmatota archaeon]
MTSAAEIFVSIRSLQAISSGARMDVLRSLKARRMTAAEVSAGLGIRKSSAHKHLSRLSHAGFVRRHDDERLWVYYSLTPHGRHLVDSERPRLVLLLATSALMSISAIVYLTTRVREALRSDPPGSWGMDDLNLYHPTFFTTRVIVALGILTLATALAVVSAWRMRHRSTRA